MHHVTSSTIDWGPWRATLLSPSLPPHLGLRLAAHVQLLHAQTDHARHILRCSTAPRARTGVSMCGGRAVWTRQRLGTCGPPRPTATARGQHKREGAHKIVGAGAAGVLQLPRLAAFDPPRVAIRRGRRGAAVASGLAEREEGRP
eukprot:363600-Chlamydomonas_euryale.AAC.5